MSGRPGRTLFRTGDNLALKALGGCGRQQNTVAVVAVTQPQSRAWNALDYGGLRFGGWPEPYALRRGACDGVPAGALQQIHGPMAKDGTERARLEPIPEQVAAHGKTG